MIKLLLGLDAVPTPHDAADALGCRLVPCAQSAAGGTPRPHAARAAAAAKLAAGQAGDARDAETLVIATLTGRLAEKHPSRVVIDVNGVGYEVHVPLSTFYELGDSGAGRGAAHPHARARGRPGALRLCLGRSSCSCSSVSSASAASGRDWR